MKKILLILAIFCLSAGAIYAGPIPNCWDDDNSDEPTFIDGSFIISIDTKPLMKSELLKLLDQVDGKYIQAVRYPIIFDDLVIIVVQAIDNGVGEYKLTREALKKTVTKELQPIADTQGISISCNGISQPSEK